MKKKPHEQSGVIAPLVALMLPVLLGTAAFVVDLAYVYLVRNEMQNDADAAALAGAHALFDPVTGVLNWDAAVTRSQQTVVLNSADGHPMSDASVQTGYWNLKGTPSFLQPQSLSPTAWDAPAVSVTLRKQSGQNQGEVKTFFARMWNVLGIRQQVTAVAAPTSPGSVLPGALFPLAMAQCMYNTYWDRSIYPPRPQDRPRDRQALCVQDRLGLPLQQLLLCRMDLIAQRCQRRWHHPPAHCARQSSHSGNGAEHLDRAGHQVNLVPIGTGLQRCR